MSHSAFDKEIIPKCASAIVYGKAPPEQLYVVREYTLYRPLAWSLTSGTCWHHLARCTDIEPQPGRLLVTTKHSNYKTDNYILHFWHLLKAVALVAGEGGTGWGYYVNEREGGKCSSFCGIYANWKILEMAQSDTTFVGYGKDISTRVLGYRHWVYILGVAGDFSGHLSHSV